MDAAANRDVPHGSRRQVSVPGCAMESRRGHASGRHTAGRRPRTRGGPGADKPLVEGELGPPARRRRHTPWMSRSFGSVVAHVQAVFGGPLPHTVTWLWGHPPVC